MGSGTHKAVTVILYPIFYHYWGNSIQFRYIPIRRLLHVFTAQVSREFACITRKCTFQNLNQNIFSMYTTGHGQKKNIENSLTLPKYRFQYLNHINMNMNFELLIFRSSNYRLCDYDFMVQVFISEFKEICTIDYGLNDCGSCLIEWRFQSLDFTIITIKWACSLSTTAHLLAKQ